MTTEAQTVMTDTETQATVWLALPETQRQAILSHLTKVNIDTALSEYGPTLYPASRPISIGIFKDYEDSRRAYEARRATGETPYRMTDVIEVDHTRARKTPGTDGWKRNELLTPGMTCQQFSDALDANRWHKCFAREMTYNLQRGRYRLIRNGVYV
jgi:hypothetical protein